MLERGLLCFCALYANALLHKNTHSHLQLLFWPADGHKERDTKGRVACCPLNQFAMISFFAHQDQQTSLLFQLV